MYNPTCDNIAWLLKNGLKDYYKERTLTRKKKSN